MGRLSICLPVLNGADHLEQALRSIAAQTSRDYVVLASDNASTDRTPDILSRWADRLPMQVFTRTETLPMFDHFNSLLDRVESENFMVLCHDDYFYSPQAVARALATADAYPETSAIYCDLAYVSERGRLLTRRRFRRSGTLDAGTVGRQCLRQARNMFGIPLLVRRRALGAHRYDPQFRYMADVDLSWTVSKDRPACHVSEVLLANRYRAGNSTWALIAGARAEFLDLARKHGVRLSRSDRLRLSVTNWQVGQKKRAFGLYERLVTRLG